MNINKDFFKLGGLFIIFLSLYLGLTYLDPLIILVASRTGDIPLFIIVVTIWSSIKLLFLGILIAIITIPLMYYVIAPLLAVGTVIECKIGISNLIKFEKEPHIGLYNQIIYAYILFAPVIIAVRLFASTIHKPEVVFYLDAIRMYTPVSFVFLMFFVSFYIVRDFSKIREIKGSLLVNYPNRLLYYISMLILGVGSITALVPIFDDILAFFNDLGLSITIFVLLILNGYLPMFTMVLSFLYILKRNKKYFSRIIERYERLVTKWTEVKTIKMEEE